MVYHAYFLPRGKWGGGGMAVAELVHLWTFISTLILILLFLKKDFPQAKFNPMEHIVSVKLKHISRWTCSKTYVNYFWTPCIGIIEPLSKTALLCLYACQAKTPFMILKTARLSSQFQLKNQNYASIGQNIQNIQILFWNLNWDGWDSVHLFQNKCLLFLFQVPWIIEWNDLYFFF